MINMPFCANCGKEHAEEDIFCSKCGHLLNENREEVVEVIDLGYPESDDLMLELGTPVSGKLEIKPGGEKLVEGTITYNVPHWKPYISERAGLVQVKQEERWGNIHWDTPKNDWYLHLGTSKPYELVIKTGVSRSNLSLGGLPLTKLRIGSGVGQCITQFDVPNPEVMQLMRIESGAGQTEIYGILNANPREVRISGGVGEVKLDFTGKPLENDVHVRVEGGVGSFELDIPKDIAAVVRVNGFAGVDLRGEFRTIQRGFGSGVYETEAYSKDGPALDIRVSVGIGGLTLRSV